MTAALPLDISAFGDVSAIVFGEADPADFSKNSSHGIRSDLGDREHVARSVRHVAGQLPFATL
jgi:hypothetical protein